jgi:glycosyltransferase involved in cell wall biosynthesis
MAFGVDSGYFTPSREWVLRSDSPAIVFVGAMTAKHNCDAVIYFMNSILPIIRIEIPDIKMQIVGRAGDGSIRSLVSQAIGVEIFENVPDVRPYLWAASVFVAPMISGTGIKTKILEAWAASCAVVSTPMGCEALEATHGDNLLIANDPKEMAMQIVRLIRDSNLRNKIGERGRETVRELYSWEKQAERLESILLRACKKMT